MNHVLPNRYPWANYTFDPSRASSDARNPSPSPPSAPADMFLEPPPGLAYLTDPENPDDPPPAPLWDRTHEKLYLASRYARRRYHAKKHLRCTLDRMYSKSICERLCKSFLGQPWKGLHAKLLALYPHKQSRDNLLRDIRNHLDQDVILINEIPHNTTRTHPLSRGYYVCPLSGCVKSVISQHGSLNSDSTRKRRRHKNARPINVLDTQQLRLLHTPGQGWRWHMIDFAPIPPREHWTQTFDHVFQTTLAYIDLTHCVPLILNAVLHTKDVYAASARLLSDNEIFTRGLSSHAPGEPKSPYGFHFKPLR